MEDKNMKETLLALYKRESTLWKNANAFYKMQDWVKMECLFIDYSEERKVFEEIGMRTINTKTGEDITDKFIDERYFDSYTIRLTNKSGTNWKSFSFRTKEEANEQFKFIMNDKILGNFKRVS